jgi:hypothetical protein
MAEIPCWKIMNCPEDKRVLCRSEADSAFPCWLSSHKTWQCKSDECRECKVYLDSEEVCAMKDASPLLAEEPAR